MGNHIGQHSQYLDSSLPVLLASSNMAKIEKLRVALEGVPRSIITPTDLGISIVIEETGSSHKEIAEAKALAWSNQICDYAVISTDGGALIPFLGSRWSSIYTGRFAGEKASSMKKIKSLLGLMDGVDGNNREVIWIEALAVARNGEIAYSEVFEGATGRLMDTFDPTIQPDDFWLSTLLFYPQYSKVYNKLNLEERIAVKDPWCSIRDNLLGLFSNQRGSGSDT